MRVESPGCSCEARPSEDIAFRRVPTDHEAHAACRPKVLAKRKADDGHNAWQLCAQVPAFAELADRNRGGLGLRVQSNLEAHTTC